MIARIAWSILLLVSMLSAGNIDTFVNAARWQVGKTLTYNPEYVRLEFPKGEPLIIHNVSSGAREEDVLREYNIVDHFRIFES